MCDVCAMTRPYADTCIYEDLAPNNNPANDIRWSEGFFDGPNGPHGSLSNGFMTVNSSYDGGIGYIGDSDYIRIDFVQGKTYHIQMYSAFMETYLALADNTGKWLVQDNYHIEQYLGYDYKVSELTVTATRTGTYYLVAEESGRNGTGGYTIDVSEEVAAPTNPDFWTLDQVAHRLTDTGWAFFNGERRAWDKDSITYNDSDLNASARALVQHAFDSWSKVTGLTFTRSNGAADIVIDDAEADSAYANSKIKGNGAIESAIINISSGFGGLGNGTFDSYEFQTFIHEIGHAIGLAHAGDYNAGSGGPTTYPDSVLFLNDSWNTTIMSYINQTMNTNDKADYALVMTPMAADVIAIQDLYGVPVSAYGGNTRYGVNSNTGDYMDDVFAALCENDFSSDLIRGGNRMSFTLWDTGGKDTVDFRTAVVDQRINLNEHKLSDIYGTKGAMVIGRDTVIENYIGGSARDVVVGNGARNRLDGRDGSDVLKGFGGKDVLRGGSGNDKLLGGAGRDKLIGQTGDDKLKGNKHVDTFVFSKGFDKDTILDFQDDTDRVRFDKSLWGGNLSAQQVADKFGSMQGGHAVFDFGGGDVLTINKISLAAVVDDLIIG